MSFGFRGILGIVHCNGGMFEQMGGSRLGKIAVGLLYIALLVLIKRVGRVSGYAYVCWRLLYFGFVFVID